MKRKDIEVILQRETTIFNYLSYGAQNELVEAVYTTILEDHTKEIEQSKKKYLIFPGDIKTSSGGYRHVGATEIMHRKGLNSDECLVVTDTERLNTELYNKLKHIHPDQDWGDRWT